MGSQFKPFLSMLGKLISVNIPRIRCAEMLNMWWTFLHLFSRGMAINDIQKSVTPLRS